MVISGTTPIGGETGGVPVAAITSPVFSTISRGSSGLPVAWAGQTLVQRPHIVHASVSSSCFQVKSSTVAARRTTEIYKDAFAAGSELHPRDALALVRGDSPAFARL